MILTILIYLPILVILFAGPIVIGQLLVFQHVFVDYSISKLLLLVGTCLSILITLYKSKVRIDVIALLTFAFILTLIRANFLAESFFTSFIKYTYFFVVMFFLYVSPINLNSRTQFVEKIFKFCLNSTFVALSTIGLMQQITNSPVFNFEIFNMTGGLGIVQNKYLLIFGYYMGKTIRSFSLFQSPVDFGIFSLISFAYFCVLYKTTKRLFYAGCVCLAIFNIYSTHTRNILLAFPLILTVMFFLHCRNIYIRKKFFHIFPFVQLLIAFLIIYLAMPLFGNQLYTESLADRIFNWKFLTLKTAENISSLVSGLGLMQEKTGGIPIDNSFIAIFCFAGIFSLILFISIYFIAYFKLVKIITTEEIRDFLFPFETAFCAMYMIFPILSMFNNFIPGIILFFMIPLLTIKRTRNLIYPNRPRRFVSKVTSKSSLCESD
jgi:hypothetical protein